MKGVILAGGLGTRLRPLTYFKPKPMVRVGNKPVLQWIVEELYLYGISDILVSTHYKHNRIIKYFGDSVIYSYEKKRRGTAGALKRIAPWLGERFFVINGDTLTNINLKNMFNFHQKFGNFATIFTLSTAVNNGGIFLFERRVIDFIPPDTYYSIHEDLIPDIQRRKIPIAMYKEAKSYYFDIGTPLGLLKARRYYAKKSSDLPKL